MKNDQITRFQTKTPLGNTINFFYNAENNLLVVDIYCSNEKGGYELLRKRLDEKKLLSHVLEGGY